MLRAAVKAATPVGLRAQDIMARGELVPDDVVVKIVSDRIEEPDARKGFILDGFPRTVPQAVALDRMLKEKGLDLDAVIELKVDGNILHERIAKRIAETQARGEALRSDDDPEVLKRRVEAYREQTAPLVDYYRWQGTLKSVDGMDSIPDVAKAIDRALAGGRAQPALKKVPKAVGKKAKAPAKPVKGMVAKAKSAGGKGRGAGSRTAGRRKATARAGRRMRG
jgi:adenylate kinase